MNLSMPSLNVNVSPAKSEADLYTLCAVDPAIFPLSQTGSLRKCQTVAEHCQTEGMKINHSKTTVLLFTKRQCKPMLERCDIQQSKDASVSRHPVPG